MTLPSIHEISPLKWTDTLNTLKRVLVDDGHLIIVEDEILPRGEKPNEYGYLVLGEEEIQTLFNMKSPPLTIPHSDDKYKDRILCALIPSEDINVSFVTVYNALELLQKNTFKKIEDIRKNKTSKDLPTGRRYAFYSQLYINTIISIEELENKIKKPKYNNRNTSPPEDITGIIQESPQIPKLLSD